MIFSQAVLGALVAASWSMSSASASPLDKRATSLSTTAAPTVALVETTIGGTRTTIEVAAPTSGSSGASTTANVGVGSTSSPSSSTPASAASTVLPAENFPVCHDTAARPFCLPVNNSDVYVGETYYLTWNPDFFPVNSTIRIILNYVNTTETQIWSSDDIPNQIGYATVDMQKDWLKDYSRYNMTVFAMEYDSSSDASATPYEGPHISLTNAPARHYSPPEPTKPPNKLGLYVGLPVCLGFVAVVVCGLFIGMRKRRKIGLGNIMGRNRGYAGGKSRRQRLGLTKKEGAIRLQERQYIPEPEYRDEELAPPPASGHRREENLGGPGSEEEGNHGNAFRNEIERQRTAR